MTSSFISVLTINILKETSCLLSANNTIRSANHLRQKMTRQVFHPDELKTLQVLPTVL